MQANLLWSFGLMLACIVSVNAQDMRHVTEPTQPPACIVLGARLQVVSGRIAASDEQKLDTVRIQHALDTCSRGHAVVLRASGAADGFLSGPIHLRDGVTLVVDGGTTLFASRDPAVYQKSPGSCGVVNQAPPGCNPLLSANHVTGAGVMGDGIIDARGGEPLLGQAVTWWQLAEQARASGRQQVPRILVADEANDFTMYRITLKNSPNFHVVYNHGDGFTVWGVKIDTPQRGARNTDGIDPGNGSSNITIAHSYIRAGDDNVAIKGGQGGIHNVSIVHNHFYWGHGMSIGSETSGGVRAILVQDLSLDGPDNGLRIKSNASRGGLVQNVIYDDVCIRNSPNPLFFDTGYTAAGALQGALLPTFKNITLKNVSISGGGKISFNGYSTTHRIGVTLDDVIASEPGQDSYSIRHADFHIDPAPTNLDLSGADVTVTGKPSKGEPSNCSDKFLPFPEAAQ
jgi:polygalacturonase